MRCEWPEKSLGDMGLLDRGRSRHRPRYADHLYGGPYPFIQTGDVKSSGGRITAHTQTYSEAGLAQSRLWPAGTLCITIAANIAETGLLTYPACFPDSIVGFTANPSICDVRFVEYCFRALRESIRQHAYGTVQENINLEVLKRLRFRVPSLPVQEQIAELLGAFDDRIDLLRQTNTTLESIGRALFKSWFIDFDPVRAKADGCEPEGMDAATAALFPAEFEESALGLIPKGWQVGSILDKASLLSGGTPKTAREDYWDGPVLWASAKDVSQSADAALLRTERTITALGLAESAARMIPAMATVIVARGATTGRMVFLGREMAMNQTCYALTSKNATPSALYCLLQREVAALLNAAHGSVFDTITTNTFAQSRVIHPPQDLTEQFENVARPLFDRIVTGAAAAHSLAELRDALLPRLISGKLRLHEAEAQLEAAAA